MTALTTLVYLHGFLSSPASPKAAVFARAAKQRGLCCQVPNLNVTDPAALSQCLADAVSDLTDGTWAAVGSSLGGFYAAHVLPGNPARVVLLNPAVNPWDYAVPYLGKTVTAADGTQVSVTENWLDFLRGSAARRVTMPERTLVMVTTGDEVLDWRKTPAYFPGAPVWTVPGSDHAVSDISRYIDALFSFLLRGDVPETLPAAAQHD